MKSLATCWVMEEVPRSSWRRPVASDWMPAFSIERTKPLNEKPWSFVMKFLSSAAMTAARSVCGNSPIRRAAVVGLNKCQPPVAAVGDFDGVRVASHRAQPVDDRERGVITDHHTVDDRGSPAGVRRGVIEDPVRLFFHGLARKDILPTRRRPLLKGGHADRGRPAGFPRCRSSGPPRIAQENSRRPRARRRRCRRWQNGGQWFAGRNAFFSDRTSVSSLWTYSCCIGKNLVQLADRTDDEIWLDLR